MVVAVVVVATACLPWVAAAIANMCAADPADFGGCSCCPALEGVVAVIAIPLFPIVRLLFVAIEGICAATGVVVATLCCVAFPLLVPLPTLSKL